MFLTESCIYAPKHFSNQDSFLHCNKYYSLTMICITVNCSVPDEPLNGTILDYSSIDTIEGSVITFQCNPGLSPEGVMTATCTNVGVWSPDPAGVECTLNVAGKDNH